MKTKEHSNNHKLVDYDLVLDSLYGQEGTSDRERFRREAYAYYTGQLIRDARKAEKMTQQELARRIGAGKSYISKIDNGDLEPGAGTFYRIIEALGLRIEILKPVY